MNLRRPSLLACYIAVLSNAAALSQSPIPGNSYNQPADAGSAPVPGSDYPQIIRPSQSTGSRKGVEQLPLTVFDAKNRLTELRSAMAVSKPQDIRDQVNHLCEWLADSADAHNKLAVAFQKHDSMKAQAASEKQSAAKFSQLKNQAQLLKADLLISEKRYPEALAPLVEIVLNEPTSATGQGAYQRLKDLGFSEEPTAAMEAAAASSLAANTQSKPQPKSPSAPTKPKLH